MWLGLATLSSTATAQSITIDGNPGDWPAVLNQPNYVSSFKVDANNTGDDQFTNGSQDPDPISGWGWSLGNTNDKGDITNAGAALIGSKLYFFGDRTAINGVAQIGFWFFKNGVGPVTVNGANVFSGSHAVGDLLVLSNFTDGGGNVNITILKWVGSGGNEGGGSLQTVSASLANANAAVNDQGYPVPSYPTWAYTPKSGSGYVQGSFFEGFVDLGNLNLDPCFTNFLLETRNSPSVNASLQDFAGGAFNTKPVAQVNSATRCSADPAVRLTASAQGGLAPLSYEWSGPGGFSATTQSIDVTAQGTYTVIVRGANGCASQPATGNVTVNATPTATAASATLCPATEGGTTATFDLTALENTVKGSQTGVSISWFSDAGLTNAITSPGAYSSATGTVYAKVSNTAAPACAASAAVSLAVNTVAPGSITGGGALCSPFDAPAFGSVGATGSGNVTYKWQQSTTSASAGFTDIGGATDPTYDAPAVTQTTWYRRVATSTLNGVACAATSNVLRVQPNSVSPGEIAGSSTVCVGGDPAAFSSPTAGSGAGNISYQWQRSTTSATTGFADIDGAILATYDAPGPINTTTWFRRVATSTLDGVQCSANSNALQVTPNSISPGSITGGGTGCSPYDAPVFGSVDATGSGDISYQWQQSTTSASAGFANIDGATDAVYDPGAVTQTTWFRRVATSTLNGVQCSDNSNALQVTPNSVVPGSIAGGGALCAPFNPAAFSNASNGSGSAPVTYQWQSKVGAGDWTNIDGATGPTYDAPAVTQTTLYRRVATSTLNGVQCSANSNELTVTPNAVAPGRINGGSTVCVGGDPAAFSNAAPGTGGGIITYQWQRSTTSATAGFADIGGATGETYDAPGPINVPTWFRRVATSTLGGVACSAPSDAVQVNVIVCGVKVCTLTQGGWSNDQGALCNNTSLRRLALINQLLGTTPLTIGIPASLQFPSSRSLTFGANQGQCIVDRMPAGGSAGAFPSGVAYTVDGVAGTCAGIPASILKNGKFNNVLIGQTLALSLNARLSSNLAGIPLSATMTTYSTINCTDNGFLSPTVTRTIAASVLQNLGTSRTVGGLLVLANRALSGQNYTANGATPSFSDISGAVAAINELFDNCRVISVAPSTSSLTASLTTTGPAAAQSVKAEAGLSTSLYPNPASADATITFSVAKSGRTVVEVYNALGARVAKLYDAEVQAGEVKSVTLHGEQLPSGTYFYRVSTAGQSKTNRFSLVK
ncbi:T9SS type A sorting domain-containing protein [Hymenobacter latericus]|uniref:T9SS type A sorting domain-containing protein n=1 Tax=Hymenobacter sp. YIM 151858-1 TaxID=2987688 RepID=UPI002227E72E|nr:T9SS type A sorting domain-containing protein [Hymenobacter sp. YIM 151858-1]UYZ60856.1 T9SS type A sorting domain-containing protein [Hymenobacter sp. YIM 151858-1]